VSTYFEKRAFLFNKLKVFYINYNENNCLKLYEIIKFPLFSAKFSLIRSTVFSIYAIFHRMSKVKTFQVDQKVVYPSQGVGIIKSITQKKFKDSKIPYYTIYLEVTDMTIMVPVDKAAGLGIRATVSRDEALKALELIGEDYEPIPSDWKMRYQMNLELLKKGSIRDIASIVRSLYHRSKVKELPILERKLYDSALKLLEDEISISLRKSKDDVSNLIFAKLELE